MPYKMKKQILAIEKKRTPKKEKKEHKEMNEYKRNLGKHHPALSTKYLMN